jgi:sugar fermentation stimulation protein A
LKFQAPLVSGTLIRRYKRFLADVILDENGYQITCAVPNTGSMMGLSDPGSRVWLSVSGNPKRKYPHTLEIVEADGTSCRRQYQSAEPHRGRGNQEWHGRRSWGVS